MLKGHEQALRLQPERSQLKEERTNLVRGLVDQIGQGSKLRRDLFGHHLEESLDELDAHGNSRDTLRWPIMEVAGNGMAYLSLFGKQTLMLLAETLVEPCVFDRNRCLSRQCRQ